MLTHVSHWSLAPTVISPHIAENIDRILHAIRLHLHMDVAFVAEFLGSNRIFRNVDCADRNAPLKAGDIIPLASGYCRHVVSGALPELIADTRKLELARSIPETASIPIGAHLSVPIKLEDGRIFGTFCCFSHRPRPELGQRDLDLLRTFGHVLAADIAADVKVDIERRASLKKISGAIAKGDPQVVFQPIRQLAGRSLVGVECLARFTTGPHRPPDQWFAEAHEVAIGSELELLVAQKAINACSNLPAPLSISINVSPDTLTSAPVAEALSGFHPGRIVIEITEHVPIADYGPILQALAPLRARGMRVAIDDAGAGYSSMRHILDMQPDIIKFDISLTRDVHRDPVRRAMAAALGEFARRTNTVLVAEGIENEGEFETLRDLGFQYGQGYLLGRPQPLQELFY
ncbi:EAL domain-containing protein [Boseaceae bacterium BT-24-1]|nr:EAL domain-containing protein [Boseaceae bacterium BT-24-1]